MNIIDKLVGAVSPVAGAKRAQARLALNYMEKNIRSYDAAGKGRRNNRNVSNASVNVETEMSLARLRARSRELDRNNPYAKKAVERIASNVVGTGIRLTMSAETKASKVAWVNWSEEREQIDFDGLLNFYGLQNLVARCVAESGEAFVRKRKTKDNASNIPIQLQVFEPEIIDSNRNNTNDRGFAIQGVQFNEIGKRIGYWMYDQYPSDSYKIMNNLEAKFVPADEVAHIYQVLRPGQVRGVPVGVSAFMRVTDFDDFEDAELIRQKIAACYAVFIAGDLGSLDTGEKRIQSEKIEPGTINYMNPGETATFTNPPAKDGIEGYSRQVLQGIAAGYGVSYEALTGDMRNVNFSSGRMGWMEFQKMITDLQYLVVIPMFCDTVFKWFIEGATVAMLSPKKVKALKANWTPPRREMIDPQKEITAMNMAVRNGFQDWGESVTELGYDPETILDNIEKYNKEFDRRGIILDSDPRKTAGGGKQQEDKTEEVTPAQATAAQSKK